MEAQAAEECGPGRDGEMTLQAPEHIMKTSGRIKQFHLDREENEACYVFQSVEPKDIYHGLRVFVPKGARNAVKLCSLLAMAYGSESNNRVTILWVPNSPQYEGKGCHSANPCRILNVSYQFPLATVQP